MLGTPWEVSHGSCARRAGVVLVLALLLTYGACSARAQIGIQTWGYNSAGQLGDGSTEDRSLPMPVSGLTDVIAMAGGGAHSFALSKDGTVWGWGRNSSGQLGLGTFNSEPPYGIATPVRVSGLTGVVAIAAGGSHSLALKSDGTVWDWGFNGYAVFSSGSGTPAPVGGLTGITAIADATVHRVALKSDGTVWDWGYDGTGIVGDGHVRNAPTLMKGPDGTALTGVIAIAAGGFHGLALKSDGTVWAWGRNGNGQLGDGTQVSNVNAVQVRGQGGVGYLSDVVAIVGGGEYSLALKSDGTVWAWGYNSVGQLGIGSDTDSLTPAPITNLTQVIRIAGGNSHSLALKADGTVWAWGYDRYGQLGNGVSGDDANDYPLYVATPAPVSGLANVVGLVGGDFYSMALYAAPVSVSGTITLEDAVNAKQALTFTFRPTDGIGGFTKTATLNADGTFSLSGIPGKRYTVHIKGDRWLASNVAIDASGGGVSNVNATLFPGDVNGDNRVDIADLGVLAHAFNTTPSDSGWNTGADLNCDGKVDIADLGLLADNFNSLGDP